MCVVSLLNISNFRVTFSSSFLQNQCLYKMNNRCKHTFDCLRMVNLWKTMANRWWAWNFIVALFQTGFLAPSWHNHQFTITNLPSPYHMNSPHLLMGVSLAPATSLRDWNVNKYKSLVLSCLMDWMIELSISNNALNYFNVV